MNTRAAPRSIEQYLKALRESLAGEDPALLQDALYDAEEYLRAELAAHPGKSEADVLELIASTYGAPDEVAEAYRATEQQVRTALAPMKPKEHRTALGRFFGVYGDARAWTALFYCLLALVTGIFYFTATVTGLSVSAGLAILIVGIPFFLLFIGFCRVLALAEGRLVEGLLGQRMPRRPPYPQKQKPLGTRIKDMLVDARTWTTLLYFVLMLPLGVIYFTVAVTGVAARPRPDRQPGARANDRRRNLHGRRVSHFGTLACAAVDRARHTGAHDAAAPGARNRQDARRHSQAPAGGPDRSRMSRCY